MLGDEMIDKASLKMAPAIAALGIKGSTYG